MEGDPFSGIISQIRLSYPVERVKFLPPFAPQKLWCIGRNYVGHVKELEHEIPSEPLVFLKATSSIIGANDFIRIPAWAGTIHYEGELAVVIGKAGKNISEEEAYDHVLGYTIMNDVTARALQNKDGQWTRAKGFDTFAPIGPCIETEFDPTDAPIQSALNGRVCQDGNTSMMMRSVSELVAFISGVMTLEPGDVVTTGTPEGVGPMQPGDTVKVRIGGIGTLVNPVVAE